MEHPEIVTELHRIDHTERAGTVVQNDLEYAGAKAMKRLGVVRLAAFSGNGERGEAFGLDLCRKLPYAPRSPMRSTLYRSYIPRCHI